MRSAMAHLNMSRLSYQVRLVRGFLSGTPRKKTGITFEFNNERREGTPINDDLPDRSWAQMFRPSLNLFMSCLVGLSARGLQILQKPLILQVHLV
jgi:hypothetical protein